MKKSTIVAIVTFFIAALLLGKAFFEGNPILVSLLTFWALGMGLAFVRLFVNFFIKSMKGKHWGIKVAFFAVLLGLGLPFQSWFRKEVLFSMPSEFMAGSVAMLVLGMIFMTLFYGIVKKNVQAAKQPSAIEQAPIR